MPNYPTIANDARKKVLELIHKGQVSHIGSNFSCIDIMTVVFEKMDFSKDIFCLSKGWAAASLYYFLWKHGRMTLEELDSFCMPGSKYIGLAEPVHPDIKIAGGSMGLSLPGAVGLALAKKLKGEEGKVYCLMSDGEVAIGTTWESLLIAKHHNLDNLVVLVDMNGLSAMGPTKDVLDLSPVVDPDDMLDGHDYDDIEQAMEIPVTDGVNFMRTIKGKGVSFMENNNLWHYAQVKDDDYKRALAELSHV